MTLPDGQLPPDGGEVPDGGADTEIPAPPLSEVPLDSPAGAAPLTRTVVTDIYDATKFLWSGASPVQAGVAPTTIDRLRVAVLRGRVLDQDGAPLAGVTVAVLGHAEVGTTLTRASGGYDLVVNGGQPLVVTFTKAGLLPAHRQVGVPLRDYVRLADVRLLVPDSQGTAVNPATAAEVLAARGTPVTDGDGTRQATLLFAPGTTATMTLAGGGTVPLAGPFTVRATEYTVGPDGPAAMPALLPPTSGYTYAVELSVDEAQAAGATSVTFDQPVVVYVDNFLGLPVGEAVPVGYYDRLRGAWVPSANGRILALVGATGGVADLDLDGDGAADPPAALASAGVSEAERRRLAEEYASPASLWRVVLTHFSPWDCNWPFGPPTDAVAPRMDLPARARCKGPCQRQGSIIECENQTLGEEVPLAGTSLRLRYQSDRVLGRTASLSLDIPLSPATLPARVKRIVVTVVVAGREFTTEAPPVPNQVAHFEWDGKDGYGRLLQGAQPVLVRIGYVYDGTYQTAEASSAAFGAISGDPIITGDLTRQEITLWQEIWTWLGLWDAAGQGLGGWSLSAHHVYDPINRIVYLGDGEQQDATALGLVSTRVAGATVGGYPCDFSGDGGPATAAQLYNPSGVAFGPDGSLYIADQSNHRVRRVRPDGVIVTVAGTGSADFGGDGGPAAAAALSAPQDVAVAPDGTIYIADAGNNRIRRVAPSGAISTFAGSGTDCGVLAGPGCGDGGPALAAQLTAPWRLALGPDGSLYVVEWSSDRVRRIAPDGTMTHFAGGPGSDLGDGSPASAATLVAPAGLAVAPDGSVLIADWGHARVRRVGADGRVRTVAGSGDTCDPTGPDPSCGDGGAALTAKLTQPSGVAVAADGTVFVADAWLNRVRKVSPDGIIAGVAGTGAPCDDLSDPTCGDHGVALQATYTAPVNLARDAAGDLYVVEDQGCRIRRLRSPLAGTSPTDIVVPSADAAEVWVFDSRGRHQRTHAALTGSVALAFAYDAEGRLTVITDPDGNSVTVVRDGTGRPTAIAAPFGQQTALILDGHGYLASVVDPLGQTVQPVHRADGLLRQLTDGRGGVSQFEYDDRGRLMKDTDAAGGSQTLVRTTTPRGWQVTVQAAEGATTTYWTETGPTGDEERRSVFPDGTQTHSFRRLDGTSAVDDADGTKSTTATGPDPRFGMAAPQVTAATLRTPGGRELNLSASTTAVLSAPGDPLALQTLTRTTVLNGRPYTAQYQAASRQWTLTSPMGRQQTLVLDSRGRVVQAEPLRGVLPLQLAYDARGRLATVTQGSGPTARSVQLGYEATTGALASLIDALGRQTTFGRDAAGRVVQQTLADGRVIAVGHDANGNITTLTPPSRPAHGFTYTPVDLQASYVPPDVGTGSTTTTYSYNRDRQLTGLTRPDGTAAALAYDAVGRLQTLTLPRGAVGFSYDAATGKLARVNAPDGGHFDFTYDGALLVGTTFGGTVSGSVTWTYDDDFRVIGESVDGSAVAFGYDNDGLLVEAGDLTVTRDAQHGLPTATSLGNVTTALTNDTFGGVQSFTVQYNGSPLLAATYVRDQLGRITSRTQTIGGTTSTWGYAYDSAGRLTEVTTNGTPAEAYAYDANGNRQGCTVDAQDRLTACGATTYAYAANGELHTRTAAGGTTTYDYDADGALLGVTLADGRRIDYVLDGYGRRLGKKMDDVLVQGLIYGDRLRPVAELDGSGNVVARFVYAGGTTPVYLVKSGTTYRVVTDHAGSPRLIVDVSSGAVAQRLDYDAFGRVLADTNPGFQPFGFAGGLYDPDTKLARFGARDYDAEAGRWTAKDPIGLAGGDANLYGYVLGDPVNARDPDGLRIVVVGDAQLFFQAIDYLRLDPGMGKLIDSLERSPKTYTVVMNDEGADFYRRRTREIFWDPRAAARCRNGATLSPSLALGHELAHAAGPWYARLTRLFSAGRFGNREEQRVILGPERSAALTLGEGLRDSHSAWFYSVPDLLAR